MNIQYRRPSDMPPAAITAREILDHPHVHPSTMYHCVERLTEDRTAGTAIAKSTGSDIIGLCGGCNDWFCAESASKVIERERMIVTHWRFSHWTTLCDRQQRGSSCHRLG
jgi:hypothetical protein